MSKASPILIHASNVTGLGAAQVITSLIEALVELAPEQRFDLVLPSIGPLARVEPGGANLCTRRVLRRLPNAFSRSLECLATGLIQPGYERGLVLGDVPLSNVRRQVVLMHRAHLVNRSEPGLIAAFHRWLFRRNARFASAVVVQSPVTAAAVAEACPELEQRLLVAPHPIPSSFLAAQAFIGRGPRLRLLYPASGYAHKNHGLLFSAAARLGPEVEILVTLGTRARQHLELAESDRITDLGSIDQDRCRELYAEVDALVFPSSIESYGLPLLEAMLSGLPVLAADRPYARWMCGAEAIYFDPQSERSLLAAIDDLRSRIDSGWRPDWSRELAKILPDWSSVAKIFLEALKER